MENEIINQLQLHSSNIKKMISENINSQNFSLIKTKINEIENFISKNAHFLVNFLFLLIIIIKI